MIEAHDYRDAEKWINRMLSGGAQVRELHDLVDTTVVRLLQDAQRGERDERHRADAAEVERDALRAEVDRLHVLGLAMTEHTQEAGR